jgi:hypothetical protein
LTSCCIYAMNINNRIYNQTNPIRQSPHLSTRYTHTHTHTRQGEINKTWINSSIQLLIGPSSNMITAKTTNEFQIFYLKWFHFLRQILLITEKCFILFCLLLYSNSLALLSMVGWRYSAWFFFFKLLFLQINSMKILL